MQTRTHDERSYGVYRTPNLVCPSQSDTFCPPETDKPAPVSAPIHTALLIVRPDLHFPTAPFFAG